MAVVNQILHRKNSSGSYDTVYLKANMANVTGTLAVANGGTGATSAANARINLGAAASSHSHDAATTSAAGFMSASDKSKLNGLSNYTHPTTKQCNAVIPDMTNYYTKTEVDKLLERTTWSLGSTVQWDNKFWLVCHIDYSVGYYLIAKDIISKTVFGSNTIYAGSTLASVAASYQSNNMSAAALAECVNVTVNGVTSKVFVPSYEQMNGGFSWFNGNTNRIAYYKGSATDYWTSSAYSSDIVWRVRTDGSLSRDNPSGSFGFRPCVCVAR